MTSTIELSTSKKYKLSIKYDTGCDTHGSCLTCPLEKCIEDNIRDQSQYYVKMRDIKIRELLKQGYKQYEIADMLKVSTRTIRRSVRRSKKW